MRRPLLAAALSVPIAVLARIDTAPSGKVVELDNYSTEEATSYINKAQCEGATTLNLQWNTITGSQTGDSYQLYASSAAPATSGTDANYCATEDIPGSGGTADVSAGPIAGGGAWTSNIQRGRASGVEAITVTDRTCTDNQVLYICAHLLDGTTRVGYASGKFTVQVTAPNAPAIGSVGPAGETSLYVTWTAPSGGVTVDRYRAVASLDGAEVASSTVEAPATSTTIKGLTLGITYSVVVYAYSLGGNEGPASGALTGAPAPVEDFWETYLNAGGRDEGGCATGSAGPLALLGLAALLRLRRRR